LRSAQAWIVDQRRVHKLVQLLVMQRFPPTLRGPGHVGAGGGDGFAGVQLRGLERGGLRLDVAHVRASAQHRHRARQHGGGEGAWQRKRGHGDWLDA